MFLIIRWQVSFLKFLKVLKRLTLYVKWGKSNSGVNRFLNFKALYFLITMYYKKKLLWHIKEELKYFNKYEKYFLDLNIIEKKATKNLKYSKIQTFKMLHQSIYWAKFFFILFLVSMGPTKNK